MSDLAWLTARPIAHRGFHDMNGARWENTLSAFAAAIEHGYAIECDVQLSEDGIPLVFHDDDLKRLTGADGNIWDHTAAHLTTLRIGRTGDRVPTLAEVLTLVAGRVPLVIELKDGNGRNAPLVKAVADTLRSYSGHVAIMSFAHRLIRRFRADAPGIPGGLTAEHGGSRDLEGHFAMLAHDIAFVSFAVADLPNPFVSLVRERLGMPVITWTVRDEQDAETTYRHADQMTFEGSSP